MSDWTATFEDDRAAKRDAWSTLTPEELLRWLEDGLDTLRDLGLLEPARAARGARRPR
ncbi:MAG TPA: hypothetical protein VGA69_06605 [Nitriliruptorales bacterium]